MTLDFLDIKIGDLIKYNFLYSNEPEKIGIVYKLKKDYNFSAMVYIVYNNDIDCVPYNIMEYKILDRKI